MRRRRAARRVCISTSLHLILIETGCLLSLFSSSLLLVLDFCYHLSSSHVALSTMGLKHLSLLYGTKRCKRADPRSFCFRGNYVLARTKGVCANYKLPRAASLDPIRSLFSGVMQLIEVIRRGFWVISSFHSAAEGLGPLARNAESSNGGSLDVLLELSLCFFISEPSLITSYQRSTTRIQLVPSARVSGAVAPPKRGVEPGLPRAGTARLLCPFAVTLLDEMSRCYATVISDKLRSSGRYHITPKYLARDPCP